MATATAVSHLPRNFTHQRQQISFGVAKKRHPQLVLRHSRDQVRLVLEVHSVFFQFSVSCLNIGYGEIQNRTG